MPNLHKRNPTRAASGSSNDEDRAASARSGGDAKDVRGATQVYVIAKNPYAQLPLKTWRGSHKVEIREATAVITGVFFPTATVISLDVTKLGALIEALETAEAEARTRCLLGP